MSSPVLVGLTGGIAAGKSTVAVVLKSMGVAVMDADQLSRVVMAPGGSAYDPVVAAFGEQILRSNGEVDRKLLGSIVFADAEKRQLLERITHPAIGAESIARIQKFADAGHRIVVYEAALLVETGRHNMVAALIVVIANDALRIERICKRDQVSPDEAAARITSQLAQQAKADLADYLIDNSGSLEQTRHQVGEIWPRLLQELGISERNGVTR